MSRLYIDTNILIYAITDSKNKYEKDLSKPARELLFESISCKHELIISDWTLKELKLKNKLADSNMLLSLAKNKIIKIKKTEEDEKLVKKQNPDNVQDQLHCILAEKAKADYIVTQNTLDFRHFDSIVKSIKPDRLL